MTSLKLWLVDTAERAGSTFVQALIMFLLVAGQTDHSEGWTKAVIAAIFPAVGSVILNAVTTLTLPTITNYWADVAIRIGRTWIATVLGAALADQFDLFQTSSWKAAAIAGMGAVLVIIKSELARRSTDKRVGVPLTPASLVTVTGAEPVLDI